MSTLRVNNLANSAGTGNIGIASGNSLLIPGSIVQVQSVRTSTTRYTISSNSLAAIPELEINFVPKAVGNKILLTAMINASSSHVSTYGFLKNNSVIIENTNTNSDGSILTVYDGQDTTDYIYGQYIEFMDTVSSLSSINYKAAASASWAGGIRALYINDRSSNDMRSISSMTIYEVAS